MNHTERGLLTGGVLGTATGAVVGHALGDPAAGAAVGGITGLAAGGIAGSAADHAEQVGELRGMKKMQAIQAAQLPQLSMYDVIRMAQNHHSDELIINQIRVTNSVYYLTPEDIHTLKRSGVSDRVVIEMQNTRLRQPSPVVVSEPPPPRNVTVIHHTPPPRVHFGFGYIHRGPGCWKRHHRCWP